MHFNRTEDFAAYSRHNSCVQLLLLVTTFGLGLTGHFPEVNPGQTKSLNASKGEPLGIVEVGVFTGRMPFLSLKCQNTEGKR